MRNPCRSHNYAYELIIKALYLWEIVNIQTESMKRLGILLLAIVSVVGIVLIIRGQSKKADTPQESPHAVAEVVDTNHVKDSLAA